MARRAPGQGSLYQTTVRSKGTEYTYWVAATDLRLPDGRRVTVRGMAPASLGEAEAKALATRRRNERLAKRLTEPAVAARVRPATAELPLQKLMETWLSSYEPSALAQSGRDKYRRDFELHLLPWLKGPIDGFTRTGLRAHFYEVLPAEGRSPRSIYNAFAALRACLRFAENEGLIPASPLRGVVVKRPTAKVREADDKFIGKRVSMTKYMLQWLADPQKCGDELHGAYPLVLFMNLGLRRGELLGLTWSCVNQLERKGKATLVVRQQLQRRKGEGWHITPRTKTGSVRTIPLPELWRKALIEQKNKGYVADEDWAQDLIFLQPPTEAGGTSRWTDYNTYNGIWHGVLDAYVNNRRKERQPLTEDERWRPHAQRHVTASLLFDAGVPLEVAQSILGHSDQAMTAYYTHLLRSKKTEATLALETALGEVRKPKPAALPDGKVAIDKALLDALLAAVNADPEPG